MLSVRSDRPIQPAALAVIRAVDKVTKELGLTYFVAGAMARDILLTHVFDLTVHRATRDVDFAVAVKDWDQFEAIKARLVEDFQFVRDKAMTHRLHGSGYPVDIIPFGGVEAPDKTIAWPPESASVINVAGYDDVLAAADTVQIEPGLVVGVASLPGLALLKLFAWADRGHENSKDATDFAILIRSYADAGNQDRLFGDAINVMEAVDYREDLAAARLLGLDVARIMTEHTRVHLTKLLEDGKARERLTTHMAREWSGTDDADSEAEVLLEQFAIGVEGT